MKKSLVSIGLLSYNRSDMLEQSVNSLLNQSYPHIEIIISDDCSTDDAGLVAKQLACKHKQIRLYQQKVNLGIPGNSNFVLGKAHGEYFFWASNDDTWHKDYIKELVQLLIKYPKAGLAMSNLVLSNGNRKQYSSLPFPEYCAGTALIRYYLCQPSLLVWGLYRTSILRKVGGFYQDSRLLYGGSDHVTVFCVLLNSGLAVTQKVLFYKYDSGYALDSYQLLQKGVSWDITRRILRYIWYPVSFSYDLVALMKKLYQFHGAYDVKLILGIWCIYWYVRVLTEYIKTILISLILVLLPRNTSQKGSNSKYIKLKHVG